MLKNIAYVVVLMIWLGAGCAVANENNTDKNRFAKEFKQCPEPRPQRCTREYRPVCATLNDGTRKTFPNGCTACADPQVTGYFPSACD